jgi:hypothetical protein
MRARELDACINISTVDKLGFWKELYLDSSNPTHSSLNQYTSTMSDQGDTKGHVSDMPIGSIPADSKSDGSNASIKPVPTNSKGDSPDAQAPKVVNPWGPGPFDQEDYCGQTHDTEALYLYGPGGLSPVHLGDIFKDGQYRILGKLGIGSWATVWLAQDTK